MSDYTPTTAEVAYRYTRDCVDHIGRAYVLEVRHGFRRWLAQHDAEVAAKALRGVADTWRTLKRADHWNLPDIDDPETSYSPDRWLEVFAEQIEREAGIR